eukprot:1158140-Pelagomonas_calceolata.AAC.2
MPAKLHVAFQSMDRTTCGRSGCRPLSALNHLRQTWMQCVSICVGCGLGSMDCFSWGFEAKGTNKVRRSLDESGIETGGESTKQVS